MAEKRYSKYRRKQTKKRKPADDRTEKTAARVYACIILCLMAFALSKVQGDYGALLRQKIKVAINSDINLERTEDIIRTWSGKIDFTGADLVFDEEESEI